LLSLDLDLRLIAGQVEVLIMTTTTVGSSEKLELASWSLTRERQFDLEDSVPAMRSLLALTETTGLPFFCVDVPSGSVVAKTADDLLELLPWSVRGQLAGLNGVRIVEQPTGLVFYSVALPDLEDIPVAAVGYVLNPDRSDDEAARQALREMTQTLGWSDVEHEQWRAAQPFCRPDLLRKLLSTSIDARSRQSWMQAEITQLTREVERAWEEIGVVHKMTRQLHLKRSSGELAGLCLSQLKQLIGADGNLVFLGEDSADGMEPLYASQISSQGRMPLDQKMLQDLLDRFPGRDWSRPLVQNNVENTLLGADQQIRNFIVARIGSDTLSCGWILLCNLPEGREFGNVEATLLQSIATLLGTHRQNRLLYHELENLLLQFVNLLVSTLDAKDAYTRGHSERVAAIARRLGEELGLPERDLDDIYQSGLLHDIGKIGVNDAILQKDDSLTDEEFDEVKKHPEIGYNILCGLKSLRPLLPGVRSHHEDFAGTGYPDGLAGEGIPLMARILAVADAYDAMRSDRPYRRGRPVATIEEIFRSDKGRQWDPAIIAAYFRVCGEIFELGQGGVTE
jgi:HD-GYP domain-containing protein (c-di-GMP phosphodiesterase class II)